ncbi:hypothetical protein [Actinomadura sp. 6N118]|uniref:hypothetical protein n=1 Tax=Actinomadura sp. 6N118 TaxID=3375151 RepID=UPI0037BA58B5
MRDRVEERTDVIVRGWCDGWLHRGHHVACIWTAPAPRPAATGSKGVMQEPGLSRSREPRG